jgi:aspartate/methionine/tyrosine aminotransferase
MKIAPFTLERYFARHEFTARHLLSNSDCEALSLKDLLAMADAESLRLWENLRLGYTETPGWIRLREEIASIYRGIGPGDVLVTVPEEGIFLSMHALLEPGDHVVCTFPAYQSLHEIARSIGCEVSGWRPDEKNGWRFDPDQLERLLKKKTRLVVVNFPHNPTGSLPTAAEFARISELVRSRGARLFSDEMYRFLEFDPGSTLPSACEIDENALSLFGLSKTFGLPGLRIGWIATRDRGISERISRLKDYTTICASAPAEVLALMALKNRDAMISRQLERLRRNLGRLEEFVAARPRFLTLTRPRGGSVCLPRLRFGGAAREFCDRLVEESGIMLVPSELFNFGDRHVRIGFGREDFPEVLSRFAGYLDENFG